MRRLDLREHRCIAFGVDKLRATPATRAQRNACSSPRRLTRVEALHSTTPHCAQTYREATRIYNIGHIAQLGCSCQVGRHVTLAGNRSTAGAALKRHIEASGHAFLVMGARFLSV